MIQIPINLTLFFHLFALFMIPSAVLRAQSALEFGYASFYADKYHGKPTASGELYDTNGLTAAHKTLPFGTQVRVTSLENNQSVEVIINDRGPFIEGRIIDISRRAAADLDMEKAGQIRVKIEILNQNGEPISPPLKIGLPDQVKDQMAREAASRKERENEGSLPDQSQPEKTSPSSPTTQDSRPTQKPEELQPANNKFQTYDLYKIKIVKPKKEGYGVQIAYLSDQRNAMRQIADLQDNWFDNVLLSIEPGPEFDPIYKIILGPFPDRPTAAAYSKSLRETYDIQGFVISLSDLHAATD